MAAETSGMLSPGWTRFGLPAGCEREWRLALMTEAAERMTIQGRMDILERTRGLPSHTVGEIIDLVNGVLSDAVNACHSLGEGLRHVHASPETEESADIEERLVAVVSRAWGLIDSDERAIIDVAGYTERMRRFDALYDELHPDPQEAK